jgi:hypothetical protein
VGLLDYHMGSVLPLHPIYTHFKGIPLEQVSRLTEVLTGELPPVPEVKLLETVLPQA